MTPEKLREYRKKLKEKGICVRCHKNKPKENCVVCQDCITTNFKSKARLRKDKTRCHQCLSRMDEFSILSGSAHCVSCMEMRSIGTKKRALIKQEAKC